MIRWISRRGNIGGTARWAAKLYKYCRDYMGAQDLPQAMNQMVIMRYDANNPLMKNAKEKMDILRYGIEEGKIEGLHSLVVAILSLEAGYNEAPISIQNMWSEIIIEELQKKDIPIEVIRGW